MIQTCLIREEDISIEYISTSNLEVLTSTYRPQNRSTEIDGGSDRSSKLSNGYRTKMLTNIDGGNDGGLDTAGTDGEMEEIEAISAARAFA